MKRLNLKYPLIVAPMAGGPSSPELVVTSCEAGALGSIGAAYSNPQAIEEFVQKVRARTKKPIAINLFIPGREAVVSEEQLSKAIQATQTFRTQFSLPTPKLAPPYEEDFDAQFETVLKLKPEVFSFVFGVLSADYVKAAKKEGILLIGTATTVDEAQTLQDSGVDAITLQGVEAGGHRGVFDPDREDPNVGISELLKQSRSKIQIPLIAAGGIMTAQDVKSILSQGADAVQIGTAFLACQEAGTSQPYRMALGAERETKLTRAFSGRLARGIINSFMKELDQNPTAILPFQAQNKFTRDIRAASAKENSAECLSLWAGTGDGELWTGSAVDLIESLFQT
ncbi:NAD(P)H-dependent flavin oxidoreductase [Bdellovibrio sp. HCB209]|uniref:NAD(P)H-dependent flavin oxidoreductase n=1 Tax=Bdellovibrio sp. HCB209 TaxID=3394354 RepID=UPI0039B3D8CC